MNNFEYQDLVVFIADDHDIVNFGVRVLLENMGVSQIYEFSSFSDLVHALKRQLPDIVVLDLEMRKILLISHIEKLLNQYQDLKVIIFSRHELADIAHRMLKSGVRGYVSKISGMAELRLAIQDILIGKTYVDQNLVRELNAFRSSIKSIETLSPKEMEVFMMLVKGLRYKEIADVLKITVNAVGSYRTRIGMKLQVNSILDLQRIAQNHNLI